MIDTRLMLLLVAAIFSLGVVALGHADHQCKHGHPSLSQKIHAREASVDVVARRRMAAQSTFRKIQFDINTTFIDKPILDVSKLTGANKSCTYVGQPLLISTETNEEASIPENCIGPNGTVDYIGNCRVICEEPDVVTAAMATALKNAITPLKSFFEKWLLVDDATDDPSDNDECGDIPVSVGLVQRNIVIYVTLRTMPYLPTTLAFANACSLHSVTHRPVTMHINVQPSALKRGDLKEILKHEIIHGLGFSTDMYRFFRHPSDRSKTYRDYDRIKYPTGPIVANSTTLGLVTMDTEDDVFGPRVDSGALGPGRTLKLVTPNVIDFARAHFKCPTLDGVELENDGGNSSAGAHWESRLLFSELMTASRQSAGKLSGFTAALLKDTGFYEIDESALVVDQMDFGFHRGCPFVNKRCNAVDAVRNDTHTWYFCNAADTEFCGYNSQFIGRCNVMSYSGPLPVEYQYFEEPTTGGSDEFSDRCPIAELFDGGLCKDRPKTSGSVFFDTNGSSTRCHRSSVVTAGLTLEGATVVKCFQTTCLSESSSMVRLGDYFFPCTAGASVEFIGSVALAKDEATALPKHDFFIRSTAGQGIFMCSDPAPMCSNSVNTLNTDFGPIVEWPVIEELDPPNVTLEEGGVYAIFGSNLESCTGVRIGDANVVEFVAANASYGTYVGPALNRQNGARGEGGAGEVQLQLRCKVGGCPNPSGCFVDYAQVLLYPSPPEEEEDDEPDSLGEFFTTTAGKVILAVVGLLVLVGLAVLLKAMFCTANEHFDEEEEIYTISSSPKSKQRPLMAQEMHDL